MHDSIADMLTRIRNSQKAQHQQVKVPASNLKLKIAHVLKEEGYIADYFEILDGKFKVIVITLKYYNGKAVIEKINRLSRPGLRRYESYHTLSEVAGFGIIILSTSQGVMTHIAARHKKIGGELLCEVA